MEVQELFFFVILGDKARQQVDVIHGKDNMEVYTCQVFDVMYLRGKKVRMKGKERSMAKTEWRKVTKTESLNTNVVQDHGWCDQLFYTLHVLK